MKNKEFIITIAQINAAINKASAYSIDLAQNIVISNNQISWTEYWYPKQIWIRNSTGIIIRWNVLSSHELTDFIAHPEYYDFIPVDNFGEAENKPSGKIEKLLIYKGEANPATADLYVYGIGYEKIGQSA